MCTIPYLGAASGKPGQWVDIRVFKRVWAVKGGPAMRRCILAALGPFVGLVTLGNLAHAGQPLAALHG